MNQVRITLAGVGALGSNLADALSRQGFVNLTLVDKDRVEVQNLGTQIYSVADVGARKVDAAQQLLFRNLEIEVQTAGKELTLSNAKRLLRDTDLVVDAFDNHASRKLLRDYCAEKNLPCLHVGMFEGYGEVVWNDKYRVPQDVAGDVCDYPLARNLTLLIVAIAAEEIVSFATSNPPRCQSWSVTLNDFSVQPY